MKVSRLQSFACGFAGGACSLILFGGIALATSSYFYDGVHVPDDKNYKFGGANDAATPDMNLGWDNSNSRLELTDGTNDFMRVTDGGTSGTFNLLDTLNVGVDDTSAGAVRSYGSSSTTSGGLFEVYQAADEDTSGDLFRFSAAASQLRIASRGGTLGTYNFMTFTPSTKLCEIASSDAAALVVRQGNSSATAGIEAMAIDNDDANEALIDFRGTAGADTTSTISTHNTSGATTDHIQIEINGTKAWIAVSTNNPSA